MVQGMEKGKWSVNINTPAGLGFLIGLFYMYIVFAREDHLSYRVDKKLHYINVSYIVNGLGWL